MSKKPTYEELGQRIKALEKSESERKQAEEALRESGEKYHTLIQNYFCVIFSVSTVLLLAGS